MTEVIKTIEVGEGGRVVVSLDPYPLNPLNNESTIRVAYRRASRYCLGNEALSDDELNEVGRKVKAGECIGTPTFAYIHGSVALAARESNPFHCPWDSGRAGWAYMTKEGVRYEFGRQRVTRRVKDSAIALISAVVDEFSKYLGGETYIVRGFVGDEEIGVEDVLGDCDEAVDSMKAKVAERLAALQVAEAA